MKSLNLMSIETYPEIQSLYEAESIFKNSLDMQKKGALISGWILTQIQDKELFKEANLSSFTSYLKSERFGYSRWQAYKWMDTYEEFKDYDVKLLDKIGIEKLYQLLAVADKEIRDELVTKSVNMTVTEVKRIVENIDRFSKNINEKVKDGDNPEDKCLRLGRTLLSKLNAFKEDIKFTFDSLQIGIDKFIKFSQKFPENKEIDILKAKILIEWQSLK